MTATAPTTPTRFTPRPEDSGPDARDADHAGAGTPPEERRPWYRRAWVLAVAAVLIAVLSFGSGFIAGNAASLFGVFGGPGTVSFDGRGGPDGLLPGNGDRPAFPGDGGGQMDQDSDDAS
jgi:hypothetical protein